MFTLLDWLKSGAQPHCAGDPIRFVAIESTPFELHYCRTTASVHIQDTSVGIESGVAYLFRDINDLRTYRQVPFCIDVTDASANEMEITPDKGESLLLLLQVAESKELPRGGYGKDPRDYGLSLVVPSSTRSEQGP